MHKHVNLLQQLERDATDAMKTAQYTGANDAALLFAGFAVMLRTLANYVAAEDERGTL